MRPGAVASPVRERPPVEADMANMKAIRIHSFGGPEVLELEEVPRPTPRAGEVLVLVRATSVNPIDWKLREGTFPDLPLPFTPGGDFSGEIAELGSGVSGYAKGDAVYGCVPHSRGAEAEYLSCPTSALAPKPRTLDHLVAASVPLAAMTAWQGLLRSRQARARTDRPDPRRVGRRRQHSPSSSRNRRARA